MAQLAIRIPKSEWYKGIPLPKDYPRLTEEGKRLARINACRQYTLPSATPEDWWSSFVTFDCLYLRDLENSRFYDEDALPYGIQQRELVEAIPANPRLVAAWPRGYAKSTTISILSLLILTTWPRFRILYITGKAGQARARMAKMMVEWETNDQLIRDFAPEYCDKGEKLSFKPLRGTSDPWSSHLLEATLRNGSKMIGGSVEGRSRGERARMLIIDDPEKDFKSSTDTEQAREYLSEFIFTTTKPILSGKKVYLVWLGTRISRKHYLWSATTLEDKRFRYWKILTYQAAYPNIDDLQVALWPEKMSLNQIRDEIQISGRNAVLSEYFNEPGGGASASLVLKEDYHSYELVTPAGEQINPSLLWNGPYANPRACDLNIRYLSGKDRKPIEVPLRMLLERSPIFQTLDWARSVSATSDYSSSAVGVFGEDGELIVLDILTGKWLASKRTEMVVRLAYLWHTSILGVETPSEEHEILLEVNARFEADALQSGYKPRVKKVSQYRGNKNEKVEGLAWRFGDPERPVGFIKLPFFLRSRPHWKMLFAQIEDCNLAAPDLGLSHDDALESVQMLQDISGHKPGRFKPIEQVRRESALDLLQKGVILDRHGRPNIEKVGIMNLSGDQIEQIMEAIEKREDRNGPEASKEYLRRANRLRRFDGLSL